MLRFLRHPVRSIREPFGTAGLIVACVALVLALTGAAFAAGKLTSKEKKEVANIAKKFAGKPGAPGAPGANGTNGAPGTSGAPGASGKSVAVRNIEPGEEECEERGGVEVKVEGSASGTEVCNGAKGSNGTNGTFSTEPLPSGQSLTGMWSAGPGANALKSASVTEEKKIEVEGEDPHNHTMEKLPVVTEVTSGTTQVNWREDASISFPIELESAPTTLVPYELVPGITVGSEVLNGGHTFFGPASPNIETLEQAEEDQKAYEEACPGTFSEPTASPGFLCIYFHEGVSTQLWSEESKLEEAHSFGINLPFSFGENWGLNAAGSWAVTAK